MNLKYIFPFVLLAAGRVWAFGESSLRDGKHLPLMVSAGFSHTCALDVEGVRCWGDTDGVGVLNSPILVSAGGGQTCVVDVEGVRCWGGTSYFSKLKSPIQISAGWFHSCVLDAEGVRCWGDYKYIKVPVLNFPIQVSAGGDHTCALDADGVKCWGSNFSGQLNVPDLKSPTQVSAGYTHTCALDSEGMKCWGGNIYDQTNVPALKSPIQISAGWDHTCALDAEGVKCWGDNSYGQTNVPILKSPVQVSAGGRHTCALDIEGLKCWGDNSKGQTNVPLLFFDIVKDAIPFMNAPRSEYIKGISIFINAVEAKSKTYYFKCLLSSPAILSMDSGYFTETYIPKFKKLIEKIQSKFGYTGDIREVPDAEEHRKLAIASIHSALSVSLSFISFDQQILLQDALRSAGIALAEPMNNQKILNLVKQVDALAAEKQKLRSSSKSAFLVDTLELAANWLREKVK